MFKRIRAWVENRPEDPPHILTRRYFNDHYARQRNFPDITMNSAGAGMHTPVRPTKRNRRTYKKGYTYGARSELGQRAEAHVRGVGVLRGKYKRTPRAVQQNIKLRMNMPLTVGHEFKTELRSKPGSQAVVTAMPERRFPTSDYSGRLVNDINVDGGGSDRYSVVGNIRGYTLATDDAVAAIPINHRQDWTMFTNGSWRDGYAYVNGGLTTATRLQGGYSTPYIAGTNTIASGLISAAGVPSNWYSTPALHLGASTPAIGNLYDVEPTSAGGMVTGAQTLLNNYYHLYEELSWTIMNPSITATTITLYECVLNRDIPITTCTSRPAAAGEVASTIQWGGLPCPLELWRQSQALGAQQTGVINADGSAELEGIVIAAPDGATEGAGVGSSSMGQATTTSGVNGGLGAKDIDYPNTLPHKARLLHTYYKVIPHTRRIPPGASTTITIGVKYNKRIPGAWWNTLYGVSGLTRTFFMVSRPDEVVGVTGADEDAGAVPFPSNRLATMNATDLLLTWRKKKTSAKHKQVAKRSVFYKAAIPEIDDVALRNATTGLVHDADVAMGQTVEGALAAEYS